MPISSDETRRPDNFRLYRRLLKAQNARDRDGFLACLADDIVFQAPAYSATGAPIAEGREAMAAMFDRLLGIFSKLDYEVKRFIPAVDPDLVLAEVRGNNRVSGKDSHYRNNYLFPVKCHGGKIAGIFEYSNPAVYAESVAG